MTVTPVSVPDLDLDLVAAQAIVDADDRSTGTGGRFSVFDVRAGVLRALAGTGVMADRSALDELATDLAEKAVAVHTVRLLDEDHVPDHVKQLVATQTAIAKTTLVSRLELLTATGDPAPTAAITQIAAVVNPDKDLDDGQVAGASMIAGTGRLVTITGAAGTGKTTMLKVAAAALHLQGRRMVVVATTKKAATVAGLETGAEASSLHQLLHTYGWRWNRDSAGRTIWTRLTIGDTDPATGRTYEGPGENVVRSQDRILVDEAGMLDLDAANALIELVHEAGAGLAAVGDPNQALPVGHSGAMELIRRNSASEVELLEVHRFRDPDWAATTLKLRRVESEEDRSQLAQQLMRTGHVRLVDNSNAVEQAMADAWFAATNRRETISLITATHAEAQSVSEAIQARRLQAGTLSTARAGAGQGGQTVFEGDIVQTRRNDAHTGVENRQNWIVSRITDDSLLLTSTTDSAHIRRVSSDYAAQHLHLGYASTVYGAQGETTDRSLVGPGVDAPGLYVGLTRGRRSNEIILTEPTTRAARVELADMMQRGSIEPSINEARNAARAELHRAAANSPASHPRTAPADSVGDIRI